MEHKEAWGALMRRYDPAALAELVEAARAWFRARECAATFRLERAVDALTPKPKRHTFGGVVFEETGEVRAALGGEWWIGSSGRPQAAGDGGTIAEYHILKPVALEGDDADS